MIKVEGDKLLKLMKILDSISEEHRVKIDENQILARTIDKTNVCLTEVYLFREECEMWKDVVEREIAFRTKPIIEYLKNNKKDDIEVSVDIKPEDNIETITFKSSKSHITLNLIDVKVVRQMPNEFEMVNEQYFNHIISVRDLKSAMKMVGDGTKDHVRFTKTDENTYISGNICEYQLENHQTDGKRGRCMFTAKYVKQILKGLEGKDMLDMYIATDRPMEVRVMGKINALFLVAPRIEGE